MPFRCRRCGRSCACSLYEGLFDLVKVERARWSRAAALIRAPGGTKLKGAGELRVGTRFFLLQLLPLRDRQLQGCRRRGSYQFPACFSSIESPGPSGFSFICLEALSSAADWLMSAPVSCERRELLS